MLELIAWPALLLLAAVSELLLAGARKQGVEPSDIGRLTDRLVQTATVVAVIGPPLLTGIVSRPSNIVSASVGMVIAILGVGLRIAAMVVLGRRYQLTPSSVNDEPNVISRWPYSLIRHPGYAGLLIFFSGLAVLSGGIAGLIFVVPLSGAVCFRIHIEEEMLRDELGTAYVKYSKEVRWRVIPKIL